MTEGSFRPGVLVSARGLRFHHDPKHANQGPILLDGIDLELRAGECLVVVGPNGAGKSTLLDLLGGLTRPLQGSVSLLGDPIDSLSIDERARRLARVPQSLDRWPGGTVRAFVTQGRYAHRRTSDPNRDATVVDEALATCDLEPLADRAVQDLSGGERQRTLVARALAQDTQVLLADEPTAALDPRGQLAVLELLTSQVCQGRAVATVTHDLTLAAQFGDRIALLHEGRLQAVGPPTEVLTQERLDLLYGPGTLYVDALPTDGAGRTAPLVVTRRRSAFRAPGADDPTDR